ncbi:MAG: coenzyme F420-0:L-glutamate ligase [Lachnospiraceae bacterium]|nr:coenzyme F420-0:L-glutamate ligase [Lachnospiraceae bacterium]
MNERLIGTVSRGVRAPIIRQGDDIAQIVIDSVLAASKSEGFELRDKDVIAVTEAVVARSMGNYASCDQIAKDIRDKFGDGTIGLIFPILSRNRFAICLKGIARGAKKIVLMLSYPSDEVGNHLIDLDSLDEKGINPWTDILTEKQFRDYFGIVKHPFTGVDYIEYYKTLIESQDCEAEVILANDCRTILKYTDSVLCCDIHTRERSKRLLKAAGAKIVYGLDDILNKSVDGSGFNSQFGLLGTNKATEETVKLFPNDCQGVVERIRDGIKAATGKNVEAMIYGDGAFKDPVGKIWELADPVVSPFFTEGLIGQPNELKLKYLADNDFAGLSGDELKEAISKRIREKDAQLAADKNKSLVGDMVSQGTTPRRLTDLIGSLCDLTSGSGDKGTPIVLIQGYFDNYTK